MKQMSLCASSFNLDSEWNINQSEKRSDDFEAPEMFYAHGSKLCYLKGIPRYALTSTLNLGVFIVNDTALFFSLHSEDLCDLAPLLLVRFNCVGAWKSTLVNP